MENQNENQNENPHSNHTSPNSRPPNITEETQLSILLKIGASLAIMAGAFYWLDEKQLLNEPHQERVKMADYYAKIRNSHTAGTPGAKSEERLRHEEMIARSLEATLQEPSMIIPLASEEDDQDAAAPARAPASLGPNPAPASVAAAAPANATEDTAADAAADDMGQVGYEVEISY